MFHRASREGVDQGPAGCMAGRATPQGRVKGLGLVVWKKEGLEVLLR